MKESGKQKVAVVTGAGGAIGAGVARRLSNEGYSVACTDLEGASAERTFSSIEGGAHFACDVTIEAEVIKLRDAVIEKLGRPTLLVNVAGLFFVHDLLATSEESFDQIIDVNLKGTFLTCKTFIPGFIEAGGGTIINVASTAGLHAGSRRPIYSVAKAGVIMLTKSITVDFGAQGVRANVICPGLIDTPMANWITQEPEALAKWEKGMPAQRIGTVDDIAKMVSFLASEDASYMFGSTVVVDGGGLA